MGKTKRNQLTIYVDPAKFDRFMALAARTRIPRTVLAREAIDDLLKKHGVLTNSSPTDNP